MKMSYLAATVIVVITAVLGFHFINFAINRNWWKPMHVIAVGGIIGGLGALIVVYATYLHNKSSTEKSNSIKLTTEQALEVAKSISNLTKLNNEVSKNTEKLVIQNNLIAENNLALTQTTNQSVDAIKEISEVMQKLNTQINSTTEFISNGVKQLTGVNSIPLLSCFVYHEEFDIGPNRANTFRINVSIRAYGPNSLSNIKIKFKPNRFDKTYDHLGRNEKTILIQTHPKNTSKFLFDERFDHGSALMRKQSAMLSSKMGPLKNEDVAPYEYWVSWSSYNYHYVATFRYNEEGYLKKIDESYNGQRTLKDLETSLFGSDKH